MIRLTVIDQERQAQEDIFKTTAELAKAPSSPASPSSPANLQTTLR
jgi:hypothetical protein